MHQCTEHEIADKLQQIEDDRLYGCPNGSNVDGSLQLNIKQLRKMIAELLLKIQHGKDGTEEEIAKMFK